MASKHRLVIPGIGDMARSLRREPPRSEKWFYWVAEQDGFRFWPMHSGMKKWKDRLNTCLYGICIPDVHNVGMKYAIEIDGGIHATAEQKEKDARKDEKYARWGFRLFRIEAYDTEAALSALAEIRVMRENVLSRKAVGKRALKILRAKGLV